MICDHGDHLCPPRPSVHSGGKDTIHHLYMSKPHCLHRDLGDAGGGRRGGQNSHVPCSIGHLRVSVLLIGGFVVSF